MKRLFLAQNRAGLYFKALVIAVVLTAMIGVGLTSAQTATPRKIGIGQTVSGTLDTKNFAQVYSFDGQASSTITLDAKTNTSGLTLALLLTDAAGNTLAQTTDLAKPEVVIRDFKIPADGTYYVTVVRGTGVQGGQGAFSLALTGTAATTTAGAVTLAQGLTITLNWATTDNMSLEVRDPIGGDATFRTPNTPSGGRFTGNVNANCATPPTEAPAQTVAWPAGNVPGGSYEIIVYYNEACPGTAPAAASTAVATAAAGATLAAGGGQVNFAVTVSVEGKALEPIRGVLNLNQQYVASFILAAPDQVTINPGGPNLGIDLTPFSGKISSPTALNTRTTVNGTIDRNNPADAWSLQIPAGGRPVTIDLNATSGSLDPFLVLIGADGSVVASNDDAGPSTRNAEITSLTLQEGRYTVVATRFGLSIGGTEGNYTLVLNTTGKAAGTTLQPTLAAGAATAPAAVATSASGLPTGFVEVTLIWNTRADMRLLIRDPNGRSVYSDNLTPDNSGILDRLGNFKCANTTSTPLTYAYWPSNLRIPGTYEVSVWLQSPCTDNTLPQYTLTVSVGNQQVINYSDRPDRGGAHFLTTFTVNNDFTATKGAGGIVPKALALSTDIDAQVVAQIPSATLVTYGTPVRGTITGNPPFAVYTFQAKAGDRVSITMRNAGGNLDPELFLLGPNGAQMNQNDDLSATDSNSQFNQNFTTDGTYVVVATRYGVELGGTTGTFQLTVDKLNR